MTSDPATSELTSPDPVVIRRAIALTVAALSVGVAIHYRDGEYMFPSNNWLYVPLRYIALAIVALAVAIAPRIPGERWLIKSAKPGELPLAALLAAIVGQFFLLIRTAPSGQFPWSDDLRDGSRANLQIYYIGVVAAVLLTLILFLLRRRYWIYPFIAILATHLFLGIWLVRSSPQPFIDVWYFQQIGGQALLDGRNPYSAEYPDIYAEKAKLDVLEQPVYGRDLTTGDKLTFGFPYPPMSLALSTAGYAMAGDHRYAQAAALTFAGLLLAFSRSGRWGALAVLLLLFTPRAFFVVGRAWTEPLVVFLLALTLFCACRFPRLLPIALGLFLASKQYLVLAVPLAWLLVPDPLDWRKAIRTIGGAILVAAAVTLPLALWNVHAFYTSTVTTQMVAPPRRDALSWLVWIADLRGLDPMVTHALAGDPWVPLLAAGLAIAACLRFCPRTPAGFAMALAAVFLPFISFNKQAFANYYLLVIGAAVAALAMLRPEDQQAHAFPVVTSRPSVEAGTVACHSDDENDPAIR